jgi:hypothetical protein
MGPIYSLTKGSKMTNISADLRKQLMDSGVDPDTLKELPVDGDPKPVDGDPKPTEINPLEQSVDEVDPPLEPQNDEPAIEQKIEDEPKKTGLDALTDKKVKGEAKKIEIDAKEVNDLRATVGKVRSLQEELRAEKAANQELAEYIGQLEAELSNKQVEAPKGEDGEWRQETSALQKQLASQEERLSQQNFRSFSIETKARIPSYDRIVNSSQWEEFLASKVPGTSRTFGQEVNGAVKAMDSDGVVEVFNHFVATLSSSTKQEPSNPAAPKPSLASLAVPDKNGASRPTSSKFLFNEDDMEKWRNEHMRGKISSEVYAANTKAFNEALRLGKVQLNA